MNDLFFPSRDHRGQETSVRIHTFATVKPAEAKYSWLRPRNVCISVVVLFFRSSLSVWWPLFLPPLLFTLMSRFECTMIMMMMAVMVTMGSEE